jgi:hypothetical protein
MNYYQSSFWKFKTDYSSYVYIRHILNDLVCCFPLGVDEAINLINSYWCHIDSFVEGDIIYHELDLTWASYIYWEPDWELKDKRPMKENRKSKYELFTPVTTFESAYVEDYIFIESNLVQTYRLKGIINEHYKKTYETKVLLNYEQALQELAEYKGEEYFKSSVFEGYY